MLLSDRYKSVSDSTPSHKGARTNLKVGVRAKKILDLSAILIEKWGYGPYGQRRLDQIFAKKIYFS
jgi:hypothetical protein